MRVITGEYRGRKLETPVGNDIRPTTDKVKEAVFNLLMNDIYDAVCVDLFAGTGNLGIEALSRGASRCYFSDNARSSLNLIKENVKRCGAEDRTIILAGDFSKNLSRIREKADVIFLDPPYDAGLYEKALDEICSLDILSDGGVVVAEHKLGYSLPQRIGDLEIDRERKYGKVIISIYRKIAEEEDE